MSDEKKNLVSSIRNRAIIKNPVLFEAIGIAPVVAMAVSLKSAIMLAVVASIELFLIEIIACLLFKKIKSSLRVMLYAVLGVLINIPLFMLFNMLAPNQTASVGIFLPLIAVNSLVALHCERIAVKSNIKDTVVDAFASTIGYSLIILLIGIVRELLGSGTIYSVDLKFPVKLPGMLMPFGGFLMLGFIAAIFKMIIAKRYPDEKPESAFNLSEISESHVDNIKNLMAEDFNPFDEVWSKDTDDDMGIKAYNPKRDELSIRIKTEKKKKSEPKIEVSEKIKLEKPKKVKEEKPLKPEKIKEEKPKKVKKEKPAKPEKIKEEKPKKIKKEKPHTPEKVKEEKPRKVKEEKPKKLNSEVKKTIKKETISSTETKPATHRREYVSEFDDLLSELDKVKSNDTDNKEGGDNK